MRASQIPSRNGSLTQNRSDSSIARRICPLAISRSTSRSWAAARISVNRAAAPRASE
jgi:hypothetical protein